MLLTEAPSYSAGPDMWTAKAPAGSSYAEQEQLDWQSSTRPWNTTVNQSLDAFTTTTGLVSASPRQAACDLYALAINAGLIGVVCVLGLVGNTVSILVLHKDRHNRVAVFLLQSLTVADNALLVASLALLTVVYGAVAYRNPATISYIQPYVVKYVNPLGYITQTATIWSTVLLAVNRYIAICRPFDAHKLCTMTKAKLQVAVVFTLSVVFNLPRFFQWNVVHVYDEELRVAKLEPSVIGEKSLFGVIYTNTLYSVLVLLLPLLLLLLLNSKLIQEIRRARRSSCVASLHGAPAPVNENITFIMVAMVVVFIVCHTPDRILQVAFYLNKRPTCPTFWFYFHHLCNLLVIVSSSVNFVVYYVFRKRFRKILKERFSRCGSGGGGVRTSSSCKTDETSEYNAHTMTLLDSMKKT